MSRNKDRLGGHKPEHTEAPTQFNPLNFVAPTEFVELPSQGKWYSKEHPLSGKDTIEIRYMTAKDEDILTSQTLLKKGVAIDRLLENVIIDKSFDPQTLLVGDKNAILISLRANGFGSLYDGHVKCKECQTTNYVQFDLMSPTYTGQEIPEELNLIQTENGGLVTEMPFSKFKVEFRFMNGLDETIISKQFLAEEDSDNLMTEQYKRMILSIEGHTEQDIINQYVDNMPVMDSRHLKLLLRNITPNIEIRSKLTCKSCSAEQEVDVPFGTDFFWPDF